MDSTLETYSRISDKNPNDPLANAKFIQVTKAYQALTDEVSKLNYEKWNTLETSVKDITVLHSKWL